MRVAAVVVTYNRVDVLRESMAALQAQSRPLDEVVVVDNASTDETAAMLGAEFPTVHVVSMDSNSGAAGGWAAGMEVGLACGHDWLWVLNDDDVPAPRALEHQIDLLAALPPRTGMLACARNGEDGVPQVLGARWVGRHLPLGPTPAGAAAVRADIVTLSATMVSAAMLREIGVLRSDLFMMLEDVDLCLRARDYGWCTWVTTDLLTTSLLMGGSGAASAWRGYYQTRNHALIALGRRSPVELFWWLVRTAKFVAAAALRRDWTRVRLRLRGALDGVRGVSGPTVRPGSA